jgi:hypothetical protein
VTAPVGPVTSARSCQQTGPGTAADPTHPATHVLITGAHEPLARAPCNQRMAFPAGRARESRGAHRDGAVALTPQERHRLRTLRDARHLLAHRTPLDGDHLRRLIKELCH